jgi:Zn-dependent protease/predicted transcriptional regulator
MPVSPGFRIGRILGIPIYVHSSWIFIFVMLTFMLNMQFDAAPHHWSPIQNWSVSIGTSLLFFASVLFHELSHSVIAQHYKIRVVSITLFIFGGIARIAREPSNAIQEFNIAIAGPLASFLLAGMFGGILLFPHGEMVGALASYLGMTNLMLGGFNLLPGFPLDGGRIFRAAVWGITKDFSRATKMAGASGKLVAYGIIALGVWYGFQHVWGSAAWLVVIGFFLLNAAQESVAQVTIREALGGLHAVDVMSHEVPTVSRDLSLEEYGQEVARTGRRCHLVITDDRLKGMINVATLNSVPRSEWVHNSVQAVMISREKILWAKPDEPLLGLLERLVAADVNQMPVVSGGENDGARIIGMITRDSILRVMQARSEVGSLSPTR